MIGIQVTKDGLTSIVECLGGEDVDVGFVGVGVEDEYGGRTHGFCVLVCIDVNMKDSTSTPSSSIQAAKRYLCIMDCW